MTRTSTKGIRTQTSSPTTIRAGSTATDTSTALTVTATVALQDGVGGRKPGGAIVDCLRAKPRSTGVGPMFTRAAPTTTIRTTMGGSSSVVRPLRFTAALMSYI